MKLTYGATVWKRRRRSAWPLIGLALLALWVWFFWLPVIQAAERYEQELKGGKR